MKNIHLLPTDKPSRLGLNNEVLDYAPLFGFELFDKNKNFRHNPVNIYITSDEEIRRGDYFISLNGDESYLDIILNNEVDDFNEYADVDWIENCKKIIITDNKDLINDGVQAIDDEFLEWFVKNPSCESVEVGYGWIRLTETDNEGYWVSIPDKRFEMQQEEPKQETLEEAAERLFPFTKDDSENRITTIKRLYWIEGAKWKEENTCKHTYVLTTEQGHKIIKCLKCGNIQVI